MKPTNTKPKKHRKLTTLLIVVLVLSLAAGGVLLYRHQQNKEAIAKERTQYAQAAKDLDNLAAQIITNLGQPEDSRKVSECGYTSSDFGTGILYCNVGHEFVYPTTSFNDAAQAAVQIEPHLPAAGPVKFGQEKDGTAVSNYPMDVMKQDFTSHGLSCFISFRTNKRALMATNSNQQENKDDTMVMLIELNCSASHPKAEYYTIENS